MAINFLNTVAVDESVLFVDTVNDRVGIGTASPSRKLVVSGAADGIIQSNDTTGDGSHLRMLADVTAQNVINWDKDTDLRFATSDEDWANYSERMRITSTGNVGIGTTSPDTKLQVEGSIQANAQGRFKGWYTSGSGLALETGVSGGNGYVLTYNRDTSAYSSTTIESTGIQFVTHSSGKFYFTGGDVGIGTTSPSEKLEVAGSVRIGNMKFEPTDAGRIGFNRNTTNGVIYNSNYPAHQINAASSTNDFFEIQSYNTAGVFQGSVAINAGKVGIGTTSPSEKLEVDGNIKIKSALLSNQEELDASIGVNVIANVAIATYTAAFFDFVIKKVGNIRSGTVYACHDGTNVEFTETSTNDLGNTSDVTLSVDISGTNMRLIATTISDEWEIKSLIRAI